MSLIGQILASAALALGAALGTVSGATAAGTTAVQVLEGAIEPADLVGYRLSGLKRGDRIAGHLHGTSGNLNLVLALVAPPFDAPAFQRRLKDEAGRAAAEGRDPREALAKAAGGVFLAWNSDDDTSYDAALNFELPRDGDFIVLVAGAPVPVSGGGGTDSSFGRFRLVLGLNAATAVTQTTPAAGNAFAAVDGGVSPPESRVQTIAGELNANRPRAILTLNAFDSGDTLTVRAESDGGRRAPTVQLLDYGQKILATSAPGADGHGAVLRYAFRAPAQEYRLRLSGDPESFGGYRLKLGANAAEIADGGEIAERGPPVARLPTPVAISLQLDQISSIAQRDGKFSVVATLRMQWRDTGYAFSPASCHCNVKTLDEVSFRRFVEERHLRWPDFVIFNLQGRRMNQGVLIFIDSNGTAHYMERFSAA